MTKTKDNKEQKISIHPVKFARQLFNRINSARQASKYLLVSVISLVVFFGLVQGAEAANHYVRAGATGANNGNDWTNAWTSLPSTLVRGDTYYIADGSYGGYTFNTTTNGSLYITIKKATIADHGTDTGWIDTYGDGQAVFSSTGAVFTVNMEYLSIDGATGSGTSGYGIVLKTTGTADWASAIYSGSTQSHLRINHVEFACPAPNGTLTNRCFADRTWRSTDQRIENSYFHGGLESIVFTSRNSSGEFSVIDHNYFQNVGGKGHSTIIVLEGTRNVVISNNVFENCLWSCTTYIEPQANGGPHPTGIDIYGNVFKATLAEEGTTNPSVLSMTAGEIMENVRIYNNTIYGLHPHEGGLLDTGIGANSGGNPSINVTVQNNLWQSNKYGPSFAGVTTQNHNILNTGEASFVNAASGNFNLAKATIGGVSLPAPYNVDPNGNIRGADGVWDIGAFEYVSDSPLSTYTLTVAKSGAGSGKVTGTGIDCGSDCTETVSSVASITLTASPDSDSVFSGWSGGGCSGTGTCTVAMNSNTTVTASFNQSETPSELIEAETGTLVSPMQIVSDSQASGSQYIQTSTADSGTAAHTFNIPTTGIYKIAARIYAANLKQDSLFFKIDSQTEDIWDFNPSETSEGYNVWREDEMTKRGIGTVNNPQYDPYTLELSQGSHTITFRGREASAKLDYFRFEQVSDTTPPAAPTGLTVN